MRASWRWDRETSEVNIGAVEPVRLWKVWWSVLQNVYRKITQGRKKVNGDNTGLRGAELNPNTTRTIRNLERLSDSHKAKRHPQEGM